MPKLLSRKGRATIDNIVYGSKQVRGVPIEFNGFSGTRPAIGKIIKKDLLMIYPGISK